MKSTKANVQRNIKENRKALHASRYRAHGLSNKSTKLSSKNFDKLMEHRRISKDKAKELKESFKKGTKMEVRHAKAGEQFLTTHGKNGSSGIYLSKRSLGKTPAERIDKGALPPSNSAKYQTKITLAKDQNIISGTIAPQPKFSKEDPKHAPRTGGGKQFVSNGGYKSGAVKKSSKKPAQSNSTTKRKADIFKNSLSRNKKTVSTKPVSKSFSKGQSM